MNYRNLLRIELQKRKLKNSRYSLRAFAAYLRISVSTLSLVLNEKRHLSSQNLIQVAKALGWRKDQIELYKNELKISDTSRAIRATKYRFIAYENHELLKNWFILAIYHLAKIPSNQSDPKWIASHLGISKSQAQAALDLLVEKKLLAVRDGKLHRCGDPTHFVEHPASASLISYKEKVFERGIKALKEVDDGHQLSLIGHLPIHPDDLPQIGKMIWQMSKKFTRISKKPEVLYYFIAQVFPVRPKK